MGSLRIGPIRFRAISGDHAGAAIPHLHADIGDGQIVIEFLPGKDVRISQAHGASIRGSVTIREQRLALSIARDAYDELIGLWKASQS